jgi:hypothetical protein
MPIKAGTMRFRRPENFEPIVPNEVGPSLSGESCGMTTLFVSRSRKGKKWAERVHKFPSDNDYQCLFLDSHPGDGIHAGAEWERIPALTALAAASRGRFLKLPTTI